MARIKLSSKNVIIETDTIEYVGTSPESIRIVNNLGREYNIIYKSNPQESLYKEQDFRQLLNILVEKPV